MAIQKHTDESTAPNRLLIVPGHGVHQAGKWYQLPFCEAIVTAGDPAAAMYEAHVRWAVERMESFESIVFSGGHTRLGLPRGVSSSEGEGMLKFAASLVPGRLPPKFVAEAFARDSFENLLYGIAACRKATGRWPTHVSVTGLAPKALRFCTMACGLALGADQFSFISSGGYGSVGKRSPGGAYVGEHEFLSDVIKGGRIFDPLLRGPAFAAKRFERSCHHWRDSGGKPVPTMALADPATTESAYMDDVMREYGGEREVAGVLRTVLGQCPGFGWCRLKLPWNPCQLPICPACGGKLVTTYEEFETAPGDYVNEYHVTTCTAGCGFSEEECVGGHCTDFGFGE